jgi:hypothetical protein
MPRWTSRSPRQSHASAGLHERQFRSHTRSTCSNQQSCFEHDCYLPGAQYSYSYEHVSGIQTSFSSSPYGMLTYMPVYKPTVSDGGEHSVSYPLRDRRPSAPAFDPLRA